MRLLIDTNYLSRLCHPRPFKPLSDWVIRNLRERPDLRPIVPEIVDYELRRGYLLELKSRDPARREAFGRSLEHLNRLVELWPPLSSTGEALPMAAELWARARREGRATSAMGRIDIDVIVAAHALLDGASILTNNAKHFALFEVDVVDPVPPLG